MGTGKFAADGREMLEGDIVHFRYIGICGRGKVYLNRESDGLGEDAFRIVDTRPGRNYGRVYPYYKDAKYRIDERNGERSSACEEQNIC